MKPDHHHVHQHRHSPSRKLILLRFVHSNAYVSIPITALTLSSYIIINNFDFNVPYISFLFFSTLFLYPLHRLMGIRLTIPIEYTLAQRQVNKKPLIAKTSVLIGLIGLLISASFFTLKIWQLILPFGIISLAYSIPLIPTNQGWKRLRDIPGLKIYAISFVVTVTTSTIPLILMHQFSTLNILMFGIQRFFFILAITIPFDIRDAHLDKKWNLKTIPLLLDNEKALKLALFFLMIPTVIALIQFFISDIFGFEIVMAIFITQIWTSYILSLFKKHNAPLFNAFLLEGTMVFHFAITTVLVIFKSLI